MVSECTPPYKTTKWEEYLGLALNQLRTKPENLPVEENQKCRIMG